jgi:hypothetical protein
MKESVSKEEFENICREAFNYGGITIVEERLWFMVYRQTCEFILGHQGAYNERGLSRSVETWKFYLNELLKKRKEEAFDHEEIAAIYIDRMMTEDSLFD